MESAQMVYVLDDDEGVRKSLQWLFEANGLRSTGFETPGEFLAEAEPDCPSCLILDMNLTQSNGSAVLREIRARPQLMMPVICLSGVGTVAIAVESMRLGARDFLEKPIDHELMLHKVREALDADAAQRQRIAHAASLKQRIDLLTEREREVLALLREGKSSKEMAVALKISVKTVSIHRWHLMKKMQASNATEAANIAHHAAAA
jgi:two-component system response regulator FixJ